MMKKKLLVIGAVAATTLLAGGLALAQSHGPFMQGGGHGGMGPDMMQHMGRGMDSEMGPGMMQRMRGTMGPGMMHGGPGLAFADPTQVEELKSQLSITAAQEPAWTKYAKTIQDAAAMMKTTREGVDPDAVSEMTPADRFAFVTKMREQGQKQFETVKTAANELLATLDDAQKTKAQDILPGLAFGPGTMHAAGMGGPQHQH
jgi:hypothetical protein